MVNHEEHLWKRQRALELFVQIASYDQGVQQDIVALLWRLIEELHPVLEGIATEGQECVDRRLCGNEGPSVVPFPGGRSSS